MGWVDRVCGKGGLTGWDEECVLPHLLICHHRSSDIVGLCQGKRVHIHARLGGDRGEEWGEECGGVRVIEDTGR